MKKFILLAATMFTLSATSAQNKDVEKLEKSLEKSDLTIADAKKAAVAGSWIDRANIFIDMANVYTKSLIQGFGLTQIQATIGAPKSTDKVEFKGVEYNENKFDKFDVYTSVDGNLISFWVSNEYPVSDPLGQALEALKKAKTLSTKDFEGVAKGAMAAGRLLAAYQADGIALYSMDRPAEAAEMFIKSTETAELTGDFDTVFMYYAGMAYYEAEQFDKAVAILDKVLAAGSDQEGTIYYYLADSYAKQGQTDKAITLLEEGFAKYPSDNTILSSLINVYVTAKQDPAKIIDLIHSAQALEPTNASLYMVESSIYGEMGEDEKSYEVLEKIMNEVDPTFFMAYYSYSIMKILEAQALNEEAGKLDLNDVKGYNEIMEKIVELQTSAIATLEKAHELDKTDKTVIDLLKQLYFPRREEEGAKERYDYFAELAQ